jgi:hypothetical protein
LAFRIARFRRPDGDELGFAGFGRAVGLLARAISDFLGAHWHPGTIHSQVHGGSHFAHHFYLRVFIAGDLSPQRCCGSFHLLGTDFRPRQFVQ